MPKKSSSENELGAVVDSISSLTRDKKPMRVVDKLSNDADTRGTNSISKTESKIKNTKFRETPARPSRPAQPVSYNPENYGPDWQSRTLAWTQFTIRKEEPAQKVQDIKWKKTAGTVDAVLIIRDPAEDPTSKYARVELTDGQCTIEFPADVIYDKIKVKQTLMKVFPKVNKINVIFHYKVSIPGRERSIDRCLSLLLSLAESCTIAIKFHCADFPWDKAELASGIEDLDMSLKYLHHLAREHNAKLRTSPFDIFDKNEATATTTEPIEGQGPVPKYDTTLSKMIWFSSPKTCNEWTPSSSPPSPSPRCKAVWRPAAGKWIPAGQGDVLEGWKIMGKESVSLSLTVVNATEDKRLLISDHRYVEIQSMAKEALTDGHTFLDTMNEYFPDAKQVNVLLGCPRSGEELLNGDFRKREEVKQLLRMSLQGADKCTFAFYLDISTHWKFDKIVRAKHKKFVASLADALCEVADEKRIREVYVTEEFQQ